MFCVLSGPFSLLSCVFLSKPIVSIFTAVNYGALIQVSINKVLRRIWRLSSRSHVPIVLSVAKIDFIQNIIHKRFNRFFFRCISSDIPIVRITSKDSSLLAYTFTGYNFLYGSAHVKSFSSSAINIAEIIKSFRFIYGSFSPWCVK